MESKFDSNGPIVAANTVFTTLWPVVQPLSVTLEMAVRSRKRPFDKLHIPGFVFIWHLHEADVPAHIAVTALVKASDPSQHSEEARLQLMPQALADWLARAHAQQLVEGHIPVLYTLEMYYTRARLLEYQKPSAELAFGPITSTIPVEKREDGLWVPGPMQDTMINPPIEITLVNGDGRLGLDICVGWSPWIETGSAEAALLTACLHEIENQGWH
jgi:hypothetical protein